MTDFGVDLVLSTVQGSDGDVVVVGETVVSGMEFGDVKDLTFFDLREWEEEGREENEEGGRRKRLRVEGGEEGEKGDFLKREVEELTESKV